MKRIISIYICFFTLICSPLMVLSAENSVQMQELDKYLDKIYLNSDMNAEIREKMQKSYQEHLEKLIPQIMQNPDYVKRKMGIDIGDDEYEMQQLYDMYALNTDTGLLVSNMKMFKYLNQYSKKDCISYLLSDVIFFYVKCNVLGGADFSVDGTYLQGDELKEMYKHSSRVLADDDVYDYLKNRNQIKNDLLAKGERDVQDVRLFGIGNITLLYIKCESNEYLVKLHDNNDNILPKIKPFEIYKANEMLEAFNDTDVKNSPYSQNISESVLTTKPTYDREAESLQSEGLLRGNEKGLDLLKPLTRIEATAMLVRAMGYENIPTSDTSYFADIQSDNWGAKYANIARDKGIAAGVGDGMFAPDEMITASQFATLILRNMGENPDWQTAINTFVERGLITSEQAEKMDLFTRGDMAKIIYEARQRSMF